MVVHPRKGSPNPFYVLLLVVSTAFAATTLGYLVGPFVERQALERPAIGPSPGSRALAAWFERHGPTALAVEFAVMLASGVLAMATDHIFSPAPKTPPRSPGPGPS
jgi:membrane protein DedA with SNARE-associated domain